MAAASSSSFSASASSSSSTPMGQKMVLAAFGLLEQEQAFGKALLSTNAFLAGGSALYWWMNNNSATPIPIPEGMDIDIWLPLPKMADQAEINRFHKIAHNYFESVFGVAGYVRQSPADHFAEVKKRWTLLTSAKPSNELCYTHSPMCKFISSIHNFLHPVLGRKIQIISVITPPEIEYYHVPKFITDTFDLDICKFVVAPTDFQTRVAGVIDFLDGPVDTTLSRAKLNFMVKEIVERRVMSLGDLRFSRVHNVLLRLEKYYARGFALEGVKPPCAHCGHADAASRRLTLLEAQEFVKSKMGAFDFEAYSAAMSVE